MEVQQDSFYVTLLSNSCLDLYPSNTLSKFTVKLPQVLNLSPHEKWSCGIVNMSHSAIKIKSPGIPAIENQPPVSAPQTNATINNSSISIRFKDGHQYNVEQRDISDMFQSNKKLISFYKDLDFSKYKNAALKLEETNWLDLHEKTLVNMKDKRQFYVRINHDYSPISLLEDILSQMVFKEWSAYIDFFQNKAVFNQSPEVRGYFTVSENTSTNRNRRATSTRTGSTPDYLCCYCDIIYPQIVSDQFSRLLLMAPIQNYGKQVLLQMNKVQYCDVEKTRISEINFLISDRYSEQIEFEASDYMTRVLLHFKKGYIRE